MKNIFFLIPIVLCSFFNLSAHTNKISSVILIEEDGVWNAQISASLSAFQYAMMKEMTKEDIKKLDADEVQKWIINHLKDNLIFYINGQKIENGNGFVKPGHQTQVKILLKNVPNKISELSVKNTSFSSAIDGHKTIFKLVLNNKPSKSFVLKQDNNYTLSFDVDGEQITLASDRFKKIKQVTLPIVLIFTLLVLFVILLLKVKKFPLFSSAYNSK